MKLNLHGAAQTVTGSMHLVEVNGSRLLECMQKKNAEYIFLVHGEERGVTPLRKKLKESRVKHVFYPSMHSSVELLGDGGR